MAEKIRIVQFGLGPIGCAIARHMTERAELEIVGAVDINPRLIGQDLGQVIGLDRPLGFGVVRRLSDVQDKADVVVHTTSSYFDLFKPQILEILAAGYNIVSTAEEMSFPWLTHPQEAAEIDAAAKKAGKTVLATGINPGFLMDSLPLNLTAVCQRVEHIAVLRLMNASSRRGPFQKKIGAGLTVAQFQQQMASGRMGHVGLVQSIGMVMDTLGKKLVRYESAVEPVVAERLVETAYLTVQPGQCIGLRQVAHGYSPEGEFVALTFHAYLDAPDEKDVITIRGKPDLEVTLRGTHGDIATVAIVVNAIRRVREAAPGLVTMRDLPIVTYW